MQTKIKDSGFTDWSLANLPNLSGKRYFITGGNSGVGFEAAKMLAGAGADIIIGCRNLIKAQQAVKEIEVVSSGGVVETVALDLSQKSSVKECADGLKQRYDTLDGLINNAGIMMTPQTMTEDGFELQLATNHLGHFLLAGLLYDLVEAASGRIVVVASIIHKQGEIHFNDLMMKDNYSPVKAYAQSKLANLMFALELDRRLQAAGSRVSCIACHPGYSATNLQATGPFGMIKALMKVLNPLFAQSPVNGALPEVLSVAGEEAIAGAYYGPQSMGEARGKVSDAKVASQALDKEAAVRLWDESEKLLDYQWPQL
ncbi:MAG: oxidoreductase [Alphaproteobacteria bacterium]